MTRYVIRHSRNPEVYHDSQGGWGSLEQAGDWEETGLPHLIEDDEGRIAEGVGSVYVLSSGYVIATVAELG